MKIFKLPDLGEGLQEERAHLGELGRIFLVDVGRVGVEIDEGDPMVFGKGSQQNEALVAREYHRLLGLVRQARADIGRDIAAADLSSPGSAG